MRNITSQKLKLKFYNHNPKEQTVLKRMKNIPTAIVKLKEYLKENNIPFVRFQDTQNYMILRASGGYHYLILKFYELPINNWKGFEFKIEEVKSLDESVKAINKYLSL